MDLTSFIISRRNEALLVGDYGSYRIGLSRRLLTLRRKLRRATPKGKKYTTKQAVTVEDIDSNTEFIHLLLLTSERAWAHAMYMKSLHAADTSEKAITGSTRSHVISRLRKSERQAGQLAQLLQHSTKSNDRTALEAIAYHDMLQGTLEFESQKWSKCLKSYSGVHVSYNSLSKTTSSQGEVFRELLSSTVDPSIRYAAYKLGQPRTVSIATIASRNVNKSSTLIQKSLGLDPAALDTAPAGLQQEKEVDSKDTPKTISWRSRKVNIEDANVAQALALANAGEQRLHIVLADSSKSHSEKTAVYDEVLNPSQDAVDATKTAIDELTADGVSQGDARMQSLYITRTAVNYALVGWRVGRNRLLCGEDDGARFETQTISLKPKKDTSDPVVKQEGNARKMARLRERVVLYDSTLQSLESIKELPGVAADTSLLGEIESKKAYFAALRCLIVARSHALLGNAKNALALFARAQSHAAKASPSKSSSTDSPSNMEVTSEQVSTLQKLLSGLVTYHRAIADIERINAEAASAERSKAAGVAPLIERLDEYPTGGADLTNLVNYPPKVRPIPVKPIFLDLAWNYIDYPGRQQQQAPLPVREKQPQAQQEQNENQAGRRGWFWNR